MCEWPVILLERLREWDVNVKEEEKVMMLDSREESQVNSDVCSVCEEKHILRKEKIRQNNRRRRERTQEQNHRRWKTEKEQEAEK